MKIALISYLYAVFFILAFLADRLPFLTLIKKIPRLSKSSFQTIRSESIEDAKKQEILLANSLGIFKQSLKITACILLLAVCGLLLLLPGGIFLYLGFSGLLHSTITTEGLVISIASFFSYFLLKRLYVKIRL